MDYREYQPGDDLRRLDWAASARSDKLIVKLYRQEVCPHLDHLAGWLAVDGPSRDGKGTGRGRTGRGAGRGGRQRGLQPPSLRDRPRLPPGEPGRRTADVLEGTDLDSAEGPPQSLAALPPPWRPHGIRVFISDLLWLGDPLELLRGIADRSSAVYVLQVLAAADADPSHLGNFRLVNSESNEYEDLFLDATALARYRRNLERHCDNWHRAARQLGGMFLTIVAEQLVANWDFSALLEAQILTV